MRAMPGTTVLVPGDLWEAEQATQAMLGERGPYYLRLDKSTAPASVRTGETFGVGRFRMIRQGKDVTLIATGGILGEALDAAMRLEAAGVYARVFSAHTVKPLDTRAIAECVAGGGGLVTVEEHAIDGGLGGAVAECCMDAGIAPAWFLRIGLRNEFSSRIGTQAYQRSAYGLDAEAIAKAVLERLPRGQIRVA